jgi:hypothetical protein
MLWNLWVGKLVSEAHRRRTRPVNQYRIYCLSDEGSFSKTAEVELATDAGAMDYARALNHQGACEIWSGTRFVGRIEGRGETSNRVGNSVSAGARS